MKTLRSFVEQLESKKRKLENELDDMSESFATMTEEEKESFNEQFVKLQNDISIIDSDILFANERIDGLIYLQRRIDGLEDEWDRVAGYRQAEGESIREEINKLEDEYSEKYNEVLFRIKGSLES